MFRAEEAFFKTLTFNLQVTMMVRHGFHVLLLILLIAMGCRVDDRDEIKCMTFNIRYGTAQDGENRWENRRDILMDVLHRHRPDILGLQEALPFQVDEIKAEFSQWKFFGKGRYHGVEIASRPQESLSGESCVIFFDAERFDLLQQGTFWHSDFPDSAASITWGNSLPRVTTWGLFKVKASEKKFVLMNTHFHWQEPYVENTSQLMMRKWREIAGNLPTIIMGDFNLSPDSWTHDLFCGLTGPEELRGRFVDCWQALGKSEDNAGTSHGFSGIPQRRIDWILVTPEFAVKEMEIVHYNIDHRFPSDHFPVHALLSL